MPRLDITRIALPTIVGALALGACSQATTSSLGQTHSESTVMVTNAPTPSSPQSSSTFRYNTDIGAAETTLDVPLDNAWARVTRAYSVLKVPITDIDSTRHLIGARRALVRDRLAGDRMSRWFSCGETAMGTPRADSYNLYVTALTQLVPPAAGSSGYVARTVVSAFATAVDASTNSVQCTSTGALEQKLSDEFTRGLMPGDE